MRKKNKKALQKHELGFKRKINEKGLIKKKISFCGLNSAFFDEFFYWNVSVLFF